MKHEKKKRWRKGMLCAIFAAAVVLPSTAIVVDPAPPQNEPVSISAFHLSAEFTSYQYSPVGRNFGTKWQDMLKRHEQLMKTPAYAKAYAQYLSSFDDLKGKPLLEQAQAVTVRVNQRMTWTSDGSGSSDYWADSIETINRGFKGDCEDHAIMKYFVMRYLGVPENRLFVATVNDKGAPEVNHAVLLLNVSPAPAKEGAKASFVILDNENMKLINTTKSVYSFFQAQNEEGFWLPGKIKFPPPPTIIVVVPATAQVINGRHSTKKIVP